MTFNYGALYGLGRHRQCEFLRFFQTNIIIALIVCLKTTLSIIKLGKIL